MKMEWLRSGQNKICVSTALLAEMKVNEEEKWPKEKEAARHGRSYSGSVAESESQDQEWREE